MSPRLRKPIGVLILASARRRARGAGRVADDGSGNHWVLKRAFEQYGSASDYVRCLHLPRVITRTRLSAICRRRPWGKDDRARPDLRDGWCSAFADGQPDDIECPQTCQYLLYGTGERPANHASFGKRHDNIAGGLSGEACPHAFCMRWRSNRNWPISNGYIKTECRHHRHRKSPTMYLLKKLGVLATHQLPALQQLPNL